MKKIFLPFFLLILSFALSGCFVLETLFPPIGANEAKVSVYMNYYTLDSENRNIRSVEIPVKSIALNGNKKENIGNKVLTLRCDQKFSDFGAFFGFFSSLANFTFPADTTLTNPHLEMEIDSPVRVVYLKEDNLGGAQATEVYFEVPADKRKIDMKLKTLTGNLNEMAELDLPEGQSEIIMLLDLDGITPLKEITGNPQIAEGFAGSFAMLTDDLCLVSGKLTDSNETPVLHPGEGFTVNLSSNFYLGETQFNYVSYPIFSDTTNRYYYMLIPQQTNSGYSSTIKVNIPDKPLKDVSKTVTIPYDKQNLEINFEFTSGD